MKGSFLGDKKFLWFVAKFLLIFCVLYFGTLAVIGLASPEGYYSPFVAEYFDYVSGIKNMLLLCTQWLLSLCGIKTQVEPGFLIRFVMGKSVFIAMDCVGYGVYSFWLAYVLSNSISIGKKIIWSFGGVLLLFIINVIRISLYLTAINRNWEMPLGVDHHTWFNIAAYLAIFLMIWRFEKSMKISSGQKSNEKPTS
ncbi:exosortase/archaeosortase family protein [Ferruginibacter sp. HRS2-29]|uniref:exosortase/archaeosortase family protein n=1 Tax=Ferruginibacter sp. HRS2-29 TaxID=2487334 RepID=UPI0020CF16B4|nr:exosortase/archaeosortase family protein [Ferruginibacter sp. HRS2-29]MCP9751925.1 hypothetical protein [Ferruginibacter sp. HRS2-29]